MMDNSGDNTEYNQFGQLQNEGQHTSNWAGILPISFGETSHGSRSSNLDDLFLQNPESSTLHLDRLSSHSAYSGTQMSDYRSLNTSRSERRSTDYQGLQNFVRIKIPSYSTETDSEGKYTAFNISVETDFATVEIKRRYKNFLTLHQELTHYIHKEEIPVLPKKRRIGVLDPSFVEERRVSLEMYLQQLCSLREAWNCSRFVEFLDDSHPFLGIQIQVAKLSDEVHYLRCCNTSLSSQLQEALATLSVSSHSIADLTGRLKAVEQRLEDRRMMPAGECSLESQRAASGFASNSPNGHLGGLFGADFSSPPKSSVGVSQSLSMGGHHHMQEVQRGEKAHCEENLLRSDSDTKYPSWSDNGQLKRQVLPDVSDFLRLSEPPGLTSDPGLPNSAIEPNSLEVPKKMSSPISLDDIPVNETPSVLDHFTDTILSYVLPTKEQLQFRFNVEKYIAKLVRKSLGAQLYQMGIQSLRCFLPDDPISLSIYLCRGLENSWYFRLNEKLCRMSAGGNMPSPTTLHSPLVSSGMGGDGATDGERDRDSSVSLENTPVAIVSDAEFDQQQDISLDTSQSSHHNHVISHVSFMNEHGEYRLQCLAGSTVVDIRANMKIDVCFFAYLEEIDRIVGREHLFKRSISLIRTWWTLEAPAYCKTVISADYLPDTSLLVMICAIFHQFHFRIFSPIQALCIFMFEYSSFDWSTTGLTVYGPVPLSSTEDKLFLKNGIIPHQITAKYVEMLGEVNGSEDSVKPEELESESVSLQKKVDAELKSPTPRRGSLTMLFGAVSEEEGDGEKCKDPELPCENAMQPNDLSSECLKIYHPLDPKLNTVPETMTLHFVGIMSEAFAIGRSKISEVLGLVDATNRYSSSGAKFKNLENSVRNLFHETVLRFGRGWRPDVVLTGGQSDDDITPRNSSSDIQSPVGATTNPQFLQDMISLEGEFTADLGRDPLEAPLETMWEQIRYCNFLLGAQVTEGTLRSLSLDILQERGPLPVGEIGKMLQEITGISTLSAYLKDKFGGLKKFLENYPDDFVISTDHPFNPHVFLRRKLSPEEFNSISQGSIPSHLATKGNKRRTSRKKRLSSGSITSELNLSSISYGSGSSMVSGSSGAGGLSRTSTPPMSGSGNFSSSPYYGHQYARRPQPQQQQQSYYPHSRDLTAMVVQRGGSSNDLKNLSSMTGYYPRDLYNSDRSHGSSHGDGESIDPSGRPYMPVNPHPRRRQTIPGPIRHGLDVLPSLPESHISDIGAPSAYGQIGMPDPHAPVFIPSRYR